MHSSGNKCTQMNPNELKWKQMKNTLMHFIHSGALGCIRLHLGALFYLGALGCIWVHLGALFYLGSLGCIWLHLGALKSPPLHHDIHNTFRNYNYFFGRLSFKILLSFFVG